MWVKSLLCTLITVVSLAKEEPDSRVVNTDHGAVRGYRAPEGDQFVFYSIPYATAPIGPHKFQAPLPSPLWLSTLEAVDERIVCPQLEAFVTGMNVKEDCLIANVYVPDTKQKNLPVVVYVHGGAFQIGYGDALTPKNLVSSSNVIAVTFNYRLGVHGFLCLGTHHAPGNAGMKDLVALLRWVNKNIKSFGGNPDDVTIAGYSAGASSVELIMLSDLAKGLFQKVILDSASSLGPAVVMDPIENAKTFARSLNFSNVDDVYALEDFYTSLDLLMSGAVMDGPDSTVLFGPCVERSSNGEEFLKDAPQNILKNGKIKRVPMLYGFSNMEGIFRLEYFESFKDKMNVNFSEFLPGYLQFENQEEKEVVAKKVKQFYFGDEPVGESNILKFVDYFGDVLFIVPVLQAVKMNVEAGNEQIYLYEYSFVDEDSPVVPHTDGVRGAEHCAQTGGVLDSKDESNITEDFRKMKVILRELWSNFIIRGEPVPVDSDLPAWDRVGSSWSPYMSLSLNPQLRTELTVHSRAQLWNEIFAKYSRVPVAPPTPPTRHTELEPVPVDSDLPAWDRVGSSWSPYMSLSLNPQLRTELTVHSRAQLWNEIFAKYSRVPVAPPTRHTEL